MFDYFVALQSFTKDLKTNLRNRGMKKCMKSSITDFVQFSSAIINFLFLKARPGIRIDISQKCHYFLRYKSYIVGQLVHLVFVDENLVPLHL